MCDEASIKKCLRAAVTSFNERGLAFASNWASEQLCGMRYESDEYEEDSNRSDHGMGLDGNDLFDYDVGGATTCGSRYARDNLLFAKNLLQNGEFHRCTNLMRKQRPAGNNAMSPGSPSTNNLLMSDSPLAMFIASYSLYLAGEKVKDQSVADTNNATKQTAEANKAAGRAGKKGAAEEDTNGAATSTNGNRNPYLNDIFRDLYPLFVAHMTEKAANRGGSISSNINNKSARTGVRMDGFLMLLFAMVVKGIRAQGGGPVELFSNSITRKLNPASKTTIEVPSTQELLMESIRLFPWNWYFILLSSLF
jgi:hypothetical protein